MQQSIAFNELSQPSEKTLSVVQNLKQHNEDFEWYPTTDGQIQIIVNDIKRICTHFDVENVTRSILDIGAGDGRVLSAFCNLLNADLSERQEPFKAYAIEKASVHTNQYHKKNITLLGTEFYETNLITKNASFAFVNPPYSDFSGWVCRIIETLNFNVLYAVIPERWQDDEQIKTAMKTRGLKYHHVIGSSDFSQGDRKARANVSLIRFSFIDLSDEAIKKDAETMEEQIKIAGIRRRFWKLSLNRDVTCPFQQFIENELGLRKTHSETTQKFSEYEERERVKKAMQDENSQCYALVKSHGVLQALLNSYEQDLFNILEQYKLISKLDGKLLGELGVEHKSIVEGVKAKLFGYRNVYWNLLFEHLDTLKERLISTHKKTLLNTLSANALDFTYTNAVYIVHYAVELANKMTESSLIDVYQTLTSVDSIKRYFKSNEHVYQDNWRYNHQYDNEASKLKQCKRALDYRFVYSSWSNFGSNSWEQGLNENAQQFTSDLVVVFRLLGYSNLWVSQNYKEMEKGDKLSIYGNHPDGDNIELITIRYYQNGNRHCKFNQEAMLRFNVTVSRILGWVRNKAQYQAETDTKKLSDEVWGISDNMKILPSNVLKLTNKKHFAQG